MEDFVLPFLQRGLRNLTDAEMEELDQDDESLKQRGLVFRKGRPQMPSLEIVIANIPEYPHLTEHPVFEFVPKETVRQILYYCEDPSRPTGDRAVNAEDKEKLSRIMQSTNLHTNLLRVKYATKYTNKSGRYYPRNDPLAAAQLDAPVGSLISVAKRLRTSIFSKHKYVDFDQVRAHPTLLTIIGKLLKIPTPGLTKYVCGACKLQEIVDFYSADPTNPVSLDSAKKLITLSLFGGGLEVWFSEMRERHKPLKNCDGGVGPQFLLDIRSEIKVITASISLTNQHLLNEQRYAGDQYKRGCKILSYFLCTIEHYITYTALEFCIDNKVIDEKDDGHIFVWGWDGFSWVPPFRGVGRALDVNGLIEGVNQHVRNTCGVAFAAVTFISKPHSGFIIPEVLDDNDELWASNDFHLYDVEPEEVLSRGEEIAAMASKTYDEVKAWFEEEVLKIEFPFVFLWLTKDKCTGNLLKVTRMASLEAVCKQYTYTGSDNKKVPAMIEKPFIGRWMGDPRLRMKKFARAYPPPLRCPEDCFNTWTYSIFHNQPSRIGESDDFAVVERFLRLIRIVSGYSLNGTPETEPEEYKKYEFIVYFIADMIQRPAIKPGVMLILGGSEGTGKSLLCLLLCLLVGYDRSSDTKIKNICGDFNSLMEDKILVVVNELSNNMTAAEVSTFKSMITDKRLSINTKHIQQYDTDSYIRFICTTNDGAWFPSDRRPVYFCSTLELHSQEFMGDKDELWRLTDLCEENRKSHIAMYRYFETINLVERFNLAGPRDIMKPPKSTDAIEIQKARNPYAAFTLFLIDSKFKGQRYIKVTADDLLIIYSDWSEATGKGEKKRMGQLDNELFTCNSWLPGAVSKPILGEGAAYRNLDLALMKESINKRATI